MPTIEILQKIAEYFICEYYFSVVQDFQFKNDQFRQFISIIDKIFGSNVA